MEGPHMEETIVVEMMASVEVADDAPGECVSCLKQCYECPYFIVPKNHDPYNVSLFNKTAMFHPDTTETDILVNDSYIHLMNNIYVATKWFVYNVLALVFGPFLACFWACGLGTVVYCIIWLVNPVWLHLRSCWRCRQLCCICLKSLCLPRKSTPCKCCASCTSCRITCQELFLGPRLQRIVKNI